MQTLMKYRTGGRIQGPGGGLADLVPAMADGTQPAALSSGEFVIPADVVSMLGDGDSTAGAEILENMIAQIRAAKQNGDTTQAPPIPGGLADV